MPMLDVSVILVNYNTREITRQCIESILKQTNGISYEIIVVDNASTDDSVAYLRSRFGKGIRIIRNHKNYGFGRANNIGAQVAQGKYLFLLNSDTILLNNAVEMFYQRAERDNGKTIYGTYLLSPDHQIIHSYADFQNLSHILVRILYLYIPILGKLRKRSLVKAIETPVEKNVDFLTGADMFLARDTFKALGGFDRQFFMYCEDEDLCLRAKRVGIRCRVLTGPKIIHLEGASSSISTKKRDMMMDSYKKFMRKNISSIVSGRC